MAVTIANDFTGSYNWAEMEAYLEASTFLELLEEEGDDLEYITDRVNYLQRKLDTHWKRVFENNEDDISSFIEKYNSMMPDEKYFLKKI